MVDKWKATDNAWLKGFRWVATLEIGDYYQSPKERADLIFSQKEKFLKRAYINGAEVALDIINVEISDSSVITDISFI